MVYKLRREEDLEIFDQDYAKYRLDREQYIINKENSKLYYKLKNDDANFYYNLAFAYQKIEKEKEYKEAIDTYNKLKG